MTDAANLPREHRHLGVYGVSVARGHILLIRKVRGPYSGQLDLPGGAIEFGEDPETALRREFIEETGLAIESATLAAVEAKLIRYLAEDGAEEDLHHIGIIYNVSVDESGAMPEPKSDFDGQDSGGAAWFMIPNLGPAALTPFARLALEIGLVSGKPNQNAAPAVVPFRQTATPAA